MSSRLSDARRARFVGRELELVTFQKALTQTELPFCVAYVHGPGGVGKSSLLRAWSLAATSIGATLLAIDARNLDGSPASLLAAIRASAVAAQPVRWQEVVSAGDAGVESAAALWQQLSAAHQTLRTVVIVDTYELLSAIDDWVRDTLLAEMPDNVLLVLGGRNAPSVAWRGDPAWGTLIRAFNLRNMNLDEAHAYLRLRSVPDSEHADIMAFTHGHPLALSLIADTVAQRSGGEAFSPEKVPDVIRTLLEQFVQRVPSPAHRAALEASALVRVMTEPLLAAMLNPSTDLPAADAATHELFDWLRGLSFVESGPNGLFLHDLARESLGADVRWRNPDWYATLHDRARKLYNRRMSQTQGLDQQRVLLDYMYLHRDNALLRRFFEWSQGNALYIDTARTAEVTLCLEWVARFEGDAQRAIAAHWIARQPAALQIVRNKTQEAVGFMLRLSMREIDATDCEIDPWVARCMAWADAQGGLRPAERGLIYRSWMSAEAHHDVCSVQSLIFVNAVQTYLSLPKLALSLFAGSPAEFWAPLFAYAEIPHVAELDWPVAERMFGMFGHNWRTVPQMLWLDLLAKKEIGSAVQSEAQAAPAELVALSEQAFAQCVRDALRDYSRPDALRANPLIGTRLVLEIAATGVSEPERVTQLRQLLARAVDALTANPRDSKLARALHMTYIEPAPTQEIASERLDVPFSTYRRHLQTGIVRVTAMLWARELGT
jgi:hypothetical protein